MKKLLTALLILWAGSVAAQTKGYMPFDTIYMQRNGGNSELIIKNATRAVKGFLFSDGTGRTSFVRGAIKLNDSTYKVGADTIFIKSTGGSGSTIDTLPLHNQIGQLNTAVATKQPQLNGTGFVKATGTTISYDNSTYLTTIDTTNIANFSVKVRSLFGATAPITYVNGTIAIAQATTSTNGYLTSTDWNTFNNKISANQTISFAPTGDVTGSTTGTTSLAPALSIGNNKVTNAILAQMAGHTYKGNNTGSTANAADITSTQLTADLNAFTASLQGLVPASGGGTTNFLRADGTWASPGGSSGWGLTGNSITAGTNFIGTTNNTSFRIRTNNVERFSIDSTRGIVLARQTALGGAFNLVNNRNFDYASNGSKPYELEVIGIDSAFQAGDISASGQFAVTSYENTTGGNSIHSRKARGTQLAPLGIPAGDRLISIGGKGYESDSAVFSNSAVAIIGTSTEPFTKTANGSSLILRTTPNGQVAGANTTLLLDQNQNATFTGAVITPGVNTTTGIVSGSLVVGAPSTTNKFDIEGVLTDGQRGFLLSDTLATIIGTSNFGALFNVKGAGSSSQFTAAVRVVYSAGYTGNSLNAGVSIINSSASTGNNLQWGSTIATPAGNSGFTGFANGTTTGLDIGGFTEAGGGVLNVGMMGKAATATNSGTNIGIIGDGSNTGSSPIQIGGYFTLGVTAPTYTSAALEADNATTTSNIFTARDNGTNVFEIQDNGKVVLASTQTTTGTTGAQTINKATGSVNFAAAAQTLVVTNSFATTSSNIFVQVEGTDATATSARITKASGSFTITLNAAATAETRVSFWVIN